MFYYYIKKLQYLLRPRQYNYPRTIVEYFFQHKKTDVISFSSINGSKKTVQNNEFFNLTKKFNVLFVKDTDRSWFNSLNINYIKSFIKKKNVYCIGYSMGAFNAIMFSNFFKVKKVIAFSPQFSIYPFISKDKTYLNYAASIKKWKYKKLKFNKTTKYYLIFGDTTNAQYHMDQIPNLKNIKKIIISNCDHESAPELKKRGQLYTLINQYFN
jgi:uncharacterized protein YlbG (UPF0298 family)